MKMKKIAIYLRVSTGSQNTDSQVKAVKEYCKRRGWKDVQPYEDKISGARLTRPALDQMLKDVREGGIDAVVVYKLDRLGRSLTQLAYFIQQLTNHGAALICTSQGIDTSESNPAGKLQMSVLMAVAEFEREIIQERVMDGLSAARAKGVKLGRPGKLAQHRKKVLALRKKGKSIRAIASELRLPVSSVGKLTKAG